MHGGSNRKTIRMKTLDTITEIIDWGKIFMSPFLIFGFIGFVLYKNVEGGIGICLFVVFLIIGLALGIYIAEKIRKKVGTSTFVNRTTPWEDSEKTG